MPEPVARMAAPMGLSANTMAMISQELGQEPNEVKLKSVYGGQVFVLYVGAPLTLDRLTGELRAACAIAHAQTLTVKWLDEEGDPCTISSQRELDEAVRLYHLNRDSDLTLHVFDGEPQLPGLPCQGEDKNVYRRGARRWKKFYRVNGHKFQAKRFNRRAQCQYCGDSIWGLGQQGYNCVDCRLFVHKRCHRLINRVCDSTVAAGPFVAGTLPSASSFPSRLADANSNHFATNGLHGVDNPIFAAGPEVAVNALVPADDADGTAGSGWRVSPDDFAMLNVIGRGSYAKVLLVESKRTGQLYAMKIIKKEMFTDDEDIDWVQTEKSVFEVASNHPFLVGLHSCFQTPSRLFFVIEFVAGGDLMFHMQRQRRLPEQHAQFYAAEITLALHFLHSRGIIYRDLKLDNVLIDVDGHVKLTDYGMCKENIGPGDVTSTFCGTPNYIAPEILRGEEYGFSVDWWALGVLLFEMLAGRSPFDIVTAGDNPDQNTEDYLFQVILEKVIRIPRSLSVKAAGILKAFLQKNPTERLGCAYDIDEGLNAIKMQPFFKTVAWDLMEAKQVVPPYKPQLVDERDLEHFDKTFTEESTQLTPDNPQVIAKIDQSEFDGFEYINPLLMAPEDSV